MLRTDDGKFAGTTICGQTFHPEGEEGAYAVFKMDSCTCGVVIRATENATVLRVHPSIKVPEGAREGFEQFKYEFEDDDMVLFDLDSADGELVLRRRLEGGAGPQEVERVLQPLLRWIDAKAFPAVMARVSELCRASCAA